MKRTAGMLILVGAAQFIISMIISEALYSGYSTADNYISDLGVGPSAIIFNSSVFLFGLMIVVGSYYLWRSFGKRLIMILFLLAGIGAMGVGIFTEDAPGQIHAVVSLVAFLFGGLSAVSAFKITRFPLNCVSVVMGLMGLVALGLFATGNFFGLGHGGMERMVAYPIVLWAIGFGGYLIGSEDKQA